MKKLLVFILVFILVIAMLLCSGCAGNKKPQIPDNGIEAPKDDDTEQTPKPEIQQPQEDSTKTNGAVRDCVKYNNINGADVEVEVLSRKSGDSSFNPNFRQAEMIYGAIQYKKAHPEEKVTIKLASFHLSVVASACLNKDSDEYGKMKSLYDCEYDENYARISYLTIAAAKYGIDVTVIGQIDASAVMQIASDGTLVSKPDYDFEQYYLGHMHDACVQGVEGEVSDYLTFRKAKWTSYGDRAAADMMHLKLCTVSHMLDGNKIRRFGVWQSATNLDCIDYRGANGNDGQQSGMVIWNHKEIYTVSSNVADLTAKYCNQEDILEFREALVSRTVEQKRLIAQGKYFEIKESERVIYLGTKDDSIFELRFTPLDGAVGAWDIENNPYAKYITAMKSSTDYVIFSASNSNFSDCEFTKIWSKTVFDAFENANSNKSRLRIDYVTNGFDYTPIKDNNLVEYFSINSNYVHSKDVQLSYVENNERKYISILSTTNIHVGSFSYQLNMMSVIKESKSTGPSFFNAFGKFNSFGGIQ